MKVKILTIGFLSTILFFVGANYVAGQSNSPETAVGNQTREQVQLSNQGEGNQIQTQNQAQVQSENETSDQIQNRNQTQNRGEDSQIQNQEQEQNELGAKSSVAEQRRSQVANAVQEMLQVAERNGGIGQQIRVIAQTHVENQEKMETNLKNIQSRGGFARFLIGPNWGEINKAKKLLEQNIEQIRQLNEIKGQVSVQSDAQVLDGQIKALEQTNLQFENSLQNAGKGFSLFGWAFRFFSGK